MNKRKERELFQDVRIGFGVEGPVGIEIAVEVELLGEDVVARFIHRGQRGKEMIQLFPVFFFHLAV